MTESITENFYPLDVDYFTENGKPVIRIYGKTTEAKRIVVLDKYFEPYFYAIPEDNVDTDDLIKKILNIKVERAEILRCSPKMMKEYGKDVHIIEIFVSHPQDVPKLREIVPDIEGVKEVREHDIPFYRRYLIDSDIKPLEKTEIKGKGVKKDYRADIILEKEERINKIKGEKKKEDYLSNLHLLSFDIEVYNPLLSPRPEKDPIIMISLADNFGYSSVLTYKEKIKNKCIEILSSEKEIIKRFVEIVNEKNPDVVIGYNTDLFDFGYLRDRAEKYKVNLDLGVDGSDLKFERGGYGSKAKIRGIPHIDLYPVIRRSFRLSKYTLEDVAEELLGREKTKISVKEIFKCWDEGGEELERLVQYSLEDAIITLEIGKNILPLQLELCKIVGQTPFDISRMTSGQLVEWLLIKKAYEYNEIVPNRPKGRDLIEREAESIVGGYVRQPEKGLHIDIVLFDFRSLYPSIIVTHNIDPSTLNCGCCVNDNVGPKSGHRFCQKEKGFIPRILEDLVKRRMDIKKSIKKEEDPMKRRILDIQQQALKILANSFYGYMGYPRARWYCREAAESVTAWGRYYIQETIKMAENFGLKVVYGDTDSLFCEANGISSEKIKDFVKQINSTLPGIIELEYEGRYKRGIFVTKKRYAMVDEDGKMVVRGLELVRRDWAQIAKETQKNVLMAILREGSPEKAAEIIRNEIKKIKGKNVNTEDLIIYTQLTKDVSEYKTDAPHVSIAKRAKKMGREISRGSIIGYVVTRGEGKIGNRALLVDEIEKFDYDPDYYIDNQLLPAVLRIMEALGYNEGDLKTDKVQFSLDMFGD